MKNEKFNTKDDNSFREACNPLLKYLNENHHPHVIAIVTSTGIELLEGLESKQNIHDFLVD